MATIRHLARAPIVEALLDIRVTLPGAPSYKTLEPFAHLVAEKYPSRRERHQVLAQWQTTPQGEITHSGSRTPVGYLLTSADGTEVVQARTDGFSFSRLEPYTSWHEVKAEAKRLWEAYIEVASPDVATRLALRYINRIPLPLPIPDFAEYVTTGPTIAADLPQSLSNFFFNATIPIPEMDMVVVISETIEQVTDDEKLPLIFDIDASSSVPMEPADSAIWKKFDELCELKDKVFFSSVTDKALELFK